MQQRAMRNLFVTGTDTGVGKTLVSAALLRSFRQRGLRVAGMKPVASGCERTPDGLRNDDARMLQAEATGTHPYAAVNPFAYEPAIAPHVAAAEAGIPIDLQTIETSYRLLAADSELVIVEGAGGWLVPLAGRSTLAELAARLELDVVLVVGLRLGCLNHAFLTAEAIAARGLRLAGWVANTIDPQYERLAANLATLDEYLPAPRLGLVPHGAPGDVAAAAAALDLAPLLR
jgi:dethiobiotin synthetase